MVTRGRTLGLQITIIIADGLKKIAQFVGKSKQQAPSGFAVTMICYHVDHTLIIPSAYSASPANIFCTGKQAQAQIRRQIMMYPPFITAMVSHKLKYLTLSIFATAAIIPMCHYIQTRDPICDPCN